MDYFDEYDDSRPRYLLRGGGGGAATEFSSSDSSAVSKPHLAVCFFASLLLALCSYYAFHLSYDILFSVLLWFSLSLILAPFAPSSATGGPVYVGGGPALPEPVASNSTADPADSSSNHSNRRSRSRKQADRSSDQTIAARSSYDQSSLDQKRSEQKAQEEKRREEEEEGKREKEEEREWTEEDLNLLRKQMAKYTVAGDPNRWEKIAAALKGRHGLESVIRTAKWIQERKAGGGDPFEQFLKKRKPVDPRTEAATSEVMEPKAELEEIWSSGEDIALLNALKAFPKEASMRWEKIAAAVPGKSKAGCMRRVSELKKDFRSMKASES